jgi:chemotaxis methyl-accepting protein methylase
MHRLSVNTTFLAHELSELRLLIERETGVLLQSPDQALIPTIAAHMESTQTPSPRDYLNQLKESDDELEALMDSLLENACGFGKHPSALAAFQRIVLPETRIRKQTIHPKTLRVWSAGCGSGQEVYEFAIATCEFLQLETGWKVHLVGSDIRKSAIEIAERGLYPESDLIHLPIGLVHSYFSQVGDHLLAKPRLRNMVAFTTMNLIQPSFLGRYDCIACLDVLPQFSTAQRIALIQRMQMYLEPGGYLLLGDHEKLPAVDISLESRIDGNYVLYRKPMARATGA